MRRILRNWKPIFCIGLLPALVACTPTLRENFLNSAQKKGWTEDEQLAGLYFFYRDYQLVKGEDGTYAVNYNRLSKRDIIRQLDDRLSDLEVILSYQNEGLNQYIKLFGLRSHLERQELVLKAVRARVLADENDKKFKKELGETSDGETSDQTLRTKGGYDTRVLAVRDVTSMFPFQSKVVEEARANGVLRVIARVTKDDSRELYRKERDPNDPRDKNKFVWIPRHIAYELIAYKVLVDGEKSNNNNPTYVEIWRIAKGKRESAPAAKIFFDGTGGVLALDKDREGEVGFGLPDVVTRISESEIASDALIAQLFPEQVRRIEPVHPAIRVELAPAGSPVDPWETCKGECVVPRSYRRNPAEDNYNVRVLFDVKKKGDTSDIKHIKFISKEWWSSAGGSELRFGPGQVVEYYKAKPQCSGALANARVLAPENRKKILFICQDGTETTGTVAPKQNRFIEEKPTQMAFTIGENRYLVWDSDNDGKFDKRRKVSTTLKYEIGIYDGDDGDDDSGHAHDHAAPVEP